MVPVPRGAHVLTTGYGYPTWPKRPVLVTAAAVLAFIAGGLDLLIGTVLVVTAGNVGNLLDLGDGVVRALAAGQIVLGALLMFGGIQALNGRDQRILVCVGTVSAGWQIIYLVAVQFELTSTLGFLLPILLVALLMTLTARSWFRAMGGRTF